MLTIAYCIEIGKEALLPSADKKGIIQSENPADSRRQDFRFVKDRVKEHHTIERARKSTPRLNRFQIQNDFLIAPISVDISVAFKSELFVQSYTCRVILSYLIEYDPIALF